MSTQAVIVTLVSSLLAGLVAVFISNLYHKRAERRRIKTQAVTRFFSNRYDLKGNEFSRALNEIFVVFNDCPEVMRALSAFHGAVAARNDTHATENALLTLSKSMCNSTDIQIQDFNDSFFLKPFNSRSSSMER